MMDFEKPPQSNSEGENKILPQEQIDLKESDLTELDELVNSVDEAKGAVSHKEDEMKLREIREELRLTLEHKESENEIEVLDSEGATQRLFEIMDKIEDEKSLPNGKGSVLEEFTTLLRTASQTKDLEAYKMYRKDRHFQALKISSNLWVQNSFDRDVHEKVISYLRGNGIETTDEERVEIKDFFKERDIERKKTVLESYAENGLLTLKSAIERGVLKETSSTPGGFNNVEEFSEFSDDESGNIRGYELTAQDINDKLFYGTNSFANVALERGSERIDRAHSLPKLEVENRLRNSMIFVVKSDKVSISRRTENADKEDVVDSDINPEEIDYLIIDKANLFLVQQVYDHLPIQIVEAGSAEANLLGLSEGPYSLPDYKGRISEITQEEDSIWCHIARLPVDTYPEESVIED
jgi:hypothetical protein